MELIILTLLFVVGTAVGSFVGVVVERESNGGFEWIKGRSVCDYCGKQILWFDNVPLLSFMILNGKCRFCHHIIPRRYPLIELFTGLLFVWGYFLNFRFVSFDLFRSVYNLQFLIGLPTVALKLFSETAFQYLSNPFIRLFGIYIFLWALVAISLVDLRFGLIPDSVLIFSGLLLVFLWHSPILILNLLWGILAALLFLFLVVLTRGRGMGMGDVKLALWMGLWLGWKVMFAVWLAFLTGAVAGIILISVRKKRWGQTVPFGPFLAWGTLVAAFAGDVLVGGFVRWVLH